MKRDIEDRKRLLGEVLKKDDWIIEGVYYKWCKQCFADADKIYLLNVPRYQYRYRIIRRFIRRKLGVERGKKETLKSLCNLLKWADEYQEKDMVEIRKILAPYSDKVIEKIGKKTMICGEKYKKEFLSTGLYLLCVLAVSWLLVHFVIQRTEVSQSSMESTLSSGDQLFVDKLSYRFREPQRFDIIVFPLRGAADTYYIKRIIGLPGETVQIDQDGSIYIDGERLEESYGREVIDPQNIGRAAEPIQLGEDEYFVMGDNRNNSTDSRSASVGNIRRDELIGRAWVRIWPFAKFGGL